MPRYRINTPGVVHETIDGETVILHLARGVYYSLDPVGADVWAAIEAGVDCSALSEALSVRYVAADDMARGVADFVETLAREGLLVEDPAAAERAAPAAKAPGRHGSERRPFVRPVLHKYTDLQDVLLLDPVHEVDDTGWPEPRPRSASGHAP